MSRRTDLPPEIARHLAGLSGPELRIGPELAWHLAPALIEWWTVARERGATSQLPGEVVKAVAWLARVHEERIGSDSSDHGTATAHEVPADSILSDERWMTTADAAQELSCSDRHIRNRCEAGQLPGARKLGSRWVIPTATVLAERVEPAA